MPALRSDALVVDALARHPDGLTQRGLVEETGLSRPTVASVVHRLLAADLVRGSDPREVQEEMSGNRPPGRPSFRLRLAPRLGSVAGIDIDHSQITVGIADMAGLLRSAPISRSIALESDGPQALLWAIDLVVDLIRREAETAPVLGVSIGFPGRVSQSGVSLEVPSFAGIDIPNFVQSRWPLDSRDGNSTIAVDSRVSLGALCFTGCRDFLYLQLSRQVEIALVISGLVHRGHQNQATGVAHVAVPARAEEAGAALCSRCGLTCLASAVSAEAIEARLGPLPMDAGDGDWRRIMAEPEAQLEFARVGRSIGASLASIVRLVTPEAVVVSGGMAHAGEPLLGAIRESLALDTRGAEPRVVSTPSDETDYTAVRGAIRHATEVARSRLATSVAIDEPGWGRALSGG
jgi:predicted NBD/HSP70 family sugar kinase